MNGFLADKTSPSVTHIPERFGLTVIVITAIVLGLLGMKRGWSNKAKRFADLPVPGTVATGTVLAGPADARFAGTVIDGQWLTRVTNHGLGLPRSIRLTVHTEGVLLFSDDWSLWIPKSDIVRIETGRGIAGDVVEPDGMIIIAWKLGNGVIASGVRIVRHAEHAEILATLNTQISSAHQGVSS